MTVLQRARSYVAREPSFTTKFAAWELGIGPRAVASRSCAA